MILANLMENGRMRKFPFKKFDKDGKPIAIRILPPFSVEKLPIHFKEVITGRFCSAIDGNRRCPICEAIEERKNGTAP